MRATSICVCSWKISSADVAVVQLDDRFFGARRNKTATENVSVAVKNRTLDEWLVNQLHNALVRRKVNARNFLF